MLYIKKYVAPFGGIKKICYLCVTKDEINPIISKKRFGGYE